MTNQIPNWLRPEAIQAVLDLSACSDTPERQSQMLFSPDSRPAARSLFTVFVESTPEGDWWRRPTSEESLAASRVKWEAERERERVLIAEHAGLMATATGLRRAVLELHAPDENGYCAGCETDYDSPKLSGCTTYALARGWPE